MTAYSHLNASPSSHGSRTRDITLPEGLDFRSTISPPPRPTSGTERRSHVLDIETDEEMNSHAIYHLSSMAHQAEAARLKHGSDSSPLQDIESRIPLHVQRLGKKRKIGESPWSGDGQTIARDQRAVQPPDPIEDGLCDEETARKLYDRWAWT